MKIKTDRKWKNVIYGYELPRKWRSEFDWLPDDEYEMGAFVKYKGNVYHNSEFIRIEACAPKEFRNWDGYISDTFFSGVVIRFSDDGEKYQIGYYYS